MKVLPKAKEKNRYLRHIKHKDPSRCLVLTVLPVAGNIYYLVKDYSEYKKDKAECAERIQLAQNEKRLQALNLARRATQASGLTVSTDQMMPASTEEQQALWLGCYTDARTASEHRIRSR